MTSELKPLPIGVQTFKTIFEGKKLYIDKTALVYDLVKAEDTRFFLSRPRRFGKEFKLNGTAEEALKQIENSYYPTRYRKQDKELILIDVEFNFEKRTIIDWKTKVILRSE